MQLLQPAAPRVSRDRMRFKLFTKLFLAVVLQGLVAGATAGAAGSSGESMADEDGRQTVFRFGGPCDDLAGMSSEQLRGLTLAGNARKFPSFCILLRGEECSDFSSFYIDLGGVFEPSAWPDACRFIPAGRTVFPGRPNDAVDPCRVGGDNLAGSYDCG